MLQIKPHKNFKKDFQRDRLGGNYSNDDFATLELVIDSLATTQKLDEKFKDHQLKGTWQHFRECHIKPDWLLVYQVDISEQLLYLVRLGSHNQIFNR